MSNTPDKHNMHDKLAQWVGLSGTSTRKPTAKRVAPVPPGTQVSASTGAVPGSSGSIGKPKPLSNRINADQANRLKLYNSGALGTQYEASRPELRTSKDLGKASVPSSEMGAGYSPKQQQMARELEAMRGSAEGSTLYQAARGVLGAGTMQWGKNLWGKAEEANRRNRAYTEQNPNAGVLAQATNYISNATPIVRDVGATGLRTGAWGVGGAVNLGLKIPGVGATIGNVVGRVAPGLTAGAVGEMIGGTDLAGNAVGALMSEPWQATKGFVRGNLINPATGAPINQGVTSAAERSALESQEMLRNMQGYSSSKQGASSMHKQVITKWASQITKQADFFDTLNTGVQGIRNTMDRFNPLAPIRNKITSGIGQALTPTSTQAATRPSLPPGPVPNRFAVKPDATPAARQARQQAYHTASQQAAAQGQAGGAAAEQLAWGAGPEAAREAYSDALRYAQWQQQSPEANPLQRAIAALRFEGLSPLTTIKGWSGAPGRFIQQNILDPWAGRAISKADEYGSNMESLLASATPKQMQERAGYYKQIQEEAASRAKDQAELERRRAYWDNYIKNYRSIPLS